MDRSVWSLLAPYSGPESEKDLRHENPDTAGSVGNGSGSERAFWLEYDAKTQSIATYATSALSALTLLAQHLSLLHDRVIMKIISADLSLAKSGETCSRMIPQRISLFSPCVNVS